MKRTVELQLEMLKLKKENLLEALQKAEKKISSLTEEKQRLEKALQKIEKHENTLLGTQSSQKTSQGSGSSFDSAMDFLSLGN